ncbi:MAG: TPM domain-containing protein [Clostridiales bacterium]|nr:TPM domain-containing protein [Clostridiales bacterium]
MKKVFSLILVFALLAALPILVFAENENPPLLIDEAGLLTESEFNALNEKLERLQSELDFDIVVLTVNDYDGKTDMEFADDYYDYNGYRYDGCILVCNPNESEYPLYVSTSGFGITAITDYSLGYLSETVKPPVLAGNYYEGFNNFADCVESFVKEARNGQAYDIDNTIDGYNPYERSTSEKIKTVVVCVIVSIVIALVIASMVKHSYTKAVKFSRDARNYLVQGSLNMTGSYDNFLYSTVTKVKIQTESSSGGGGSSTHTSSSGSSHGGGRL